VRFQDHVPAHHTNRCDSFYYADERREDGSPVLSAVNGQAHADHFFELAAQLEQGPWLSTFVKDKGYVQFQ
jgi:hypothetical protein